MLFNKFIFIIPVLALILAGCGSELYNEKAVISVHEHLSDMVKGADLANTMDKTGIKKIVLVGAYNSTFDQNQPTRWSSADENNKLLFDVMNKAPEKILVFPLIRGDENDLVSYAKDLFKKGAPGFALANGLAHQRLMPLDDPRLDLLYAWCELHRIPLFFEVDFAKFQEEFENVLRGYPNLLTVAAQMLTLSTDLGRLSILLNRHPNLFLDFSFGPESYKYESMKSLSENIKFARELMIKHKDKIIFGTNVGLFSGPGRNVDWLTQYFLDDRRFLEQSSVKIKLLLNGTTTINKFNGLNLPKEVLPLIYHYNFQNLLGERAPEVDKYNLDKLLVGSTSNAKLNEEGAYRLVTGVVTSLSNPIEGLFSAWLKNLLAGQVKNWRELAGIDMPIKVMAVAPLDKWIPARLGVEKAINIEAVANSSEIVAQMRNNPGILAFVPFNQLSPLMKILTVDGETPAGSYIADCAKRGGATIGNYFYSYPLLIPLEISGTVGPELIYSPHLIRNVIISGSFLPAKSLTANAKPVDEAVSDIFQLLPLLRRTDIAHLELGTPMVEGCNTNEIQGKSCIPPVWVEAFDAAGIDILEQTDREQFNFGLPVISESIARYKRHFIYPLGAGSNDELAALPVRMKVRNKRFDFLGYHLNGAAPIEGLNQFSTERAVMDIAQARNQGAEVFVQLNATDLDPDQNLIEQAAHAAIDAGALAVSIALNGDPHKIEFYKGRLIAHGLGNLMSGPHGRQGSDIAFMIRHTFYRERHISIEIIPLQETKGLIQRLHAEKTKKALNYLFNN